MKRTIEIEYECEVKRFRFDDSVVMRQVSRVVKRAFDLPYAYSPEIRDLVTGLVAMPDQTLGTFLTDVGEQGILVVQGH